MLTLCTARENILKRLISDLGNDSEIFLKWLYDNSIKANFVKIVF